MKKGLLNIILLVLALTNIVLSAIIVFAVVPAMNSTADLVTKVASAIDLEKEGMDQTSDTISIDDIEIYDFSSKITVVLKDSTTTKTKYAQFGVTLTLDTTDSDYSKYSSGLAEKETLMKSTINSVVSKYTTSELQNNQQAILEEITLALRELYNNSTFIYETSFSEIIFQ